MRRLVLFAALVAGLAALRAACGQTAPPAVPAGEARLDALLRDGFTYRNVGPFRAGSWVADIAVPEMPAKTHAYTFYVAARNGGVWKTVNGGTTFTPLFNDQDVLSMGCVSVAPSDENIVWAGTGDASCTRSATWGDGVYKSVDGGKTWQKMGLADSQHVARIVIHPTNPDIVWVAAMGHLYSTNEERGVYKTTDGGKTWKKVLYINDRTGAIDLIQNRRDPNTLYAAMYECMRAPWILMDGGPGTGIHKSTDGGETWQKLEGGLPTGAIGRIGLDLFRPNPDILYAIIDNRNPAPPGTQLGRGRGAGGGGGPSLVGGEAYRSDDGGKTWKKTNAPADDLSRKSGYAFNQIRVDTHDANRLYITGSSMATSEDGGKTWSGLTGGGGSFRRAFGDFRTIWIDPENSDRMLAGSDGGVFTSFDGGRTCEHKLNLPLGEVYALAADMEAPYNIYEGLQDHESWKGPSNGWSGQVGIEDWSTVGIGDGMYNQVDWTDSRWVYNTQEFGRLGRFDQKTRTRTIIAPPQPEDAARFRYNWVAPVRLSPQDPKVVYVGSQFLFRSPDRGDHWERISPDLTTNDPKKISPTGATIQHCTITTICESPAKGGVIWVGTDDGKAQVTQDGGKTWTDATAQIAAAGGPEDAWVTRVCASPTQAGTAYVAKSRNRQDDFRPFLYKTTDFGATWKAISGNLPMRAINVVFEDYKNPNLVFVGNDTGVFASVDGGGHWSRLKGNMPNVPVTDVMVHPRDGDLIAGTYGRGTWITGIAPLREINEEILAQGVHFFTVQSRPTRREGAQGNYRLYGDSQPATPNEPNGPAFEYYLKDATQAAVSITVANAGGAIVRTLNGTGRAGINRVLWSGGAGGRGGGGRGRGGTAELPAGEYTITLHVGDSTYVQKAHLEAVVPSSAAGEGEDEDVDDDVDVG